MLETHHRVRNNLQMIAAIADMQVMEGGDTIPTEEVQRIASQVQALAAVHDILTEQAREGGEAHTLSARQVLEKLVELLRETAGVRQIHAECDEIYVSARQGSSLAIIANELILNALKNSPGPVLVSFRIEEGQAVLRVEDSGAGFAESFDPVSSSSTGLELVRNVARYDLNARLHFGNGPEGGGLVTMTMPIQTESVAA